jgi:hypothetical protein
VAAEEERAVARAIQAKKDAELAVIEAKREEERAKIRAAAEAQPSKVNPSLCIRLACCPCCPMPLQ